MIRKLLLALAFLGFATPALAQNTQCSDRPTGDSSNACANTRFVGTNAPPIGTTLGWYIVGSSQYPTAQGAITAANTAGGGVVYFPCKSPPNSTISIGAAAIGLDMRNMRNVRLVGGNSVNAGGAVCTYVNYTGTGTAIDISGSIGVEISGILLFGQSAGTLIKASNQGTLAAYLKIDRSNFQGKTTASGLCFDLSYIIIADITGSSINCYIGIRGLSTGGDASNAINIGPGNTFQALNSIHMQNAGFWNVDRNTIEGSLLGIAYQQTVTGCNTLNVTGNKFDDPVAGTTLVDTSCTQYNSKNNTYSVFTGGTAVNYQASSGKLSSDGDWFDTTGVGVNINTGNYASVTNYTAPLVSAVISGTPASAIPLDYIYGPIVIQSASANTLAIGLNGATNPVLQIDDSQALQATGFRFIGAPAGSGASMNVISSGTNESAFFNAKGTGAFIINNNGSGGVQLAGGGGGVSALSALTVTSASANALAAGRQGATNPVLNVDASTATVVTGLNIKGAAAAGGLALSVISSGTNENLTIDAKGSGTVNINGTATGSIMLGKNSAFGTVPVVGISANASATIPATGSAANLAIAGVDTGTAAINLQNFSAVSAFTSPGISGFRARGTGASPAAVSLDDVLFGLSGYGYFTSGGTGYGTGAGGGFFVRANENETSANQGSRIEFFTTANGTNTSATRMILQQGLGVGTATDPGAGSAQLNAQFFMPNITQTSAAQTGTVCWTTGTGKFTVDTTVGCLASVLKAKNVIEHLSPSKALDIISRLDAFSFRYKDGWGDSGRYEQFGFGAEQVALVDERLVGRDPEGSLQGVRYQEMTAVLAGAIQNLNERTLKLERQTK